MRPFSRRQPDPGRPGFYISFWARTEDITLIDDLSDFWGLNRSATIKNAIAEQHRAVGTRKLKARRRKRES